MTVLVKPGMKVIIQGITGKQGRFHTKLMQEYGMDVVAGVTPGKGGEIISKVPVFNTVKEALSHTDIDASLVLVPPAFVKDSATEAIKNSIPLVVITTEFVPVHDSLKISELSKEYGVRVVGPNTIGVISPGIGKVGIMPGYIYSKGNVGVVSRSGTLTHEVSSNLTYSGIGQSTCIGIGGDPIKGMDFVDVLEMFREDPDTDVIVLIGEIGGSGEESAADYIRRSGYPKPVVAFIAGQTAPEGKKMGHAGAIVSGNSGTAQSKIFELTEAGVIIAESLAKITELVSNFIKPSAASEKECSATAGKGVGC